MYSDKSRHLGHFICLSLEAEALGHTAWAIAQNLAIAALTARSVSERLSPKSSEIDNICSCNRVLSGNSGTANSISGNVLLADKLIARLPVSTRGG